MYTFILYIAGDSPHSVQALANLKAICADHFPHGHRLEIVDVLLEPDRGLNDGIFVAPNSGETRTEAQKDHLGGSDRRSHGAVFNRLERQQQIVKYKDSAK